MYRKYLKEKALIPEGWRYEELNSVVASLDAGVSVNSEDRPKTDGEIGVLKVSAVTYGFFDSTAYKTVLPSEIDRLSVIPQRDTIIVSRANTTELVGASAYVDRDYPDLFLPDKLWRITLCDEHSARWLSYVLASETVRSRISSRATGTSGSMKNISQEAFLTVLILIPPPPEQRKIAAVLSTWDEAITLTEQLIAALQRRKQALMQVLLTGQVRFAEFEGEAWEQVRIGDVASLTAGATPSTYVPEYWGGEIRWMSSGEVHQKRVYEVEGRITEQGLNNSSTKLIPINSVLVALAGQGKTRGTVAINKVELTTNQSIAAIIPDPKKIHYEYLFYNLGNRYDELRRLSTGDGGRGGLNLQILKAIYVQIPAVPEQQKISDALRVCDEEIDLLSQSIAQLQTQKRGLMQQLLTGAVRVQVEE